MNSKPPLEIQVACATDYGGDTTPYRFWLGERCVNVITVLDRWLAPDHHYFKTQGDDSGTYIIRHDVTTGHWELTLFTLERA